MPETNTGTAKFGIEATHIADVPNAVTPKQLPVDTSMAQGISAIGNAAVAGANIYADSKENSFRSRVEAAYRAELGIPDDAPIEQRELFFYERVQQLEQVAQIGSVDKANLRLEQELRIAKTSHPWLAKRFDRAAARVKGDYSTTTSILAQQEHAMGAEAAAQARESRAEIKLIRETALRYGRTVQNVEQWTQEQKQEFWNQVVFDAQAENNLAHLTQLQTYQNATQSGQFAAENQGFNRANQSQTSLDNSRKNYEYLRDQQSKAAVGSVARADLNLLYNQVSTLLNNNEAPNELKRAVWLQIRQQSLSSFSAKIRRDGVVLDEEATKAESAFRANLDATDALFFGDLSPEASQGIAVESTRNKIQALADLYAPDLAIVRAAIGDQAFTAGFVNIIGGISSRKDESALFERQVSTLLNPPTAQGRAADRGKLVVDVISNGGGESLKNPQNKQDVAIFAKTTLGIVGKDSLPQPDAYGSTWRALANSVDVGNPSSRFEVYSMALDPNFETRFDEMSKPEKRETAGVVTQMLKAGWGEWAESNSEELKAIRYSEQTERFRMQGTAGPSAQLKAANNFLERLEQLSEHAGGKKTPEELYSTFFSRGPVGIKLYEPTSK